MTIQISSAEPAKRSRSTPSSITLGPQAAEVRARFMSRLEFCRAMNMGQTKYHALVKAGLIKPVKLGRSVLVPVTECDALIERMAA